jgi:hybrid cluster-associated redox disulfide protein
LDASEKPDLEMSLDEIMRRWPATIGVFIRHGMLCVGCPIGIFHNVRDACDAHAVNRARFEDELRVVIGGDGEEAVPSWDPGEA